MGFVEGSPGRLPHHSLRLLGVALLVLAGLGLWYNAGNLFTRFPPDPSEPYFLHAFYSMSAICIACYVTLLFIGVQFIRLRTSWFKPFVGVVVFEVVYFFAVVFFSSDSDPGRSVDAASTFAMIGMMFQFIPLLPIWGPLLARWATKAIDAPETGDESVFPQEQVDRLSDWAWAVIHFLGMFLLASVLLGLIWRRLYSGTFSRGYVTSFTLLLSTAHGLLSVRLLRRRRRKDIQRRRNDRSTRGLCPCCEYSLTGNVSGVCPECGEKI